MAEAVIYTILAIFAVYGMYTAAREVVIFLGRLHGKRERRRDLCHGCNRGCNGCGKADNAEQDQQDEDEDDKDFFCT